MDFSLIFLIGAVSIAVSSPINSEYGEVALFNRDAEDGVGCYIQHNVGHPTRPFCCTGIAQPDSAGNIEVAGCQPMTSMSECSPNILTYPVIYCCSAWNQETNRAAPCENLPPQNPEKGPDAMNFDTPEPIRERREVAIRKRQDLASGLDPHHPKTCDSVRIEGSATNLFCCRGRSNVDKHGGITGTLCLEMFVGDDCLFEGTVFIDPAPSIYCCALFDSINRVAHPCVLPSLQPVTLDPTPDTTVAMDTSTTNYDSGENSISKRQDIASGIVQHSTSHDKTCDSIKFDQNPSNRYCCLGKLHPGIGGKVANCELMIDGDNCQSAQSDPLQLSIFCCGNYDKTMATASPCALPPSLPATPHAMGPSSDSIVAYDTTPYSNPDTTDNQQTVALGTDPTDGQT